jgi:hypothetical protein
VKFIGDLVPMMEDRYSDSVLLDEIVGYVLAIRGEEYGKCTID